VTCSITISKLLTKWIVDIPVGIESVEPLAVVIVKLQPEFDALRHVGIREENGIIGPPCRHRRRIDLVAYKASAARRDQRAS